jgi:hypothetical protein
MPSAVVTAINDHRAALLAREASAMQTQAQAWLRVEQSIQAQVDALALELANTSTPSMGMLQRSRRYRALMEQTRDELRKYEDFMEPRIRSGQQDMITLALQHSAQAVNAVATEAGIVVPFDRLPVSAVNNMVGLAGDGSPLRAVLADASRVGPDALANELVTGIALGRNPIAVARQAIRLGLGQSFTRMQTIARTEQLRTYRETTLQSYGASNVVIGYKRLSARDDRVCFVAGTMVSTPDGDRPIESICVGDTVLTHVGARRVTKTMARPYAGDLITYTRNGITTTCTPEHPVWVGRAGEYKWLPAKELCSGDELVLTQQVNQHLAGNGGDGSGSFPSQVNRAITLPGEKGIAPFFLGGVLMPVPSIGFEREIVGQDKIDGVASDWNLFPVGNTKFQESIFASDFERRISGMRPIAVGSAEVVSINNCAGTTSELFPAMGTSDYVGGAAAFLGTIVPVVPFVGKEHLTASLAGDISGFFGSAFPGTNRVSFFVGRSYGKVFSADGAFFSDGWSRCRIAFTRAVQSLYGGRALELFATLGACKFVPATLENSATLTTTAQAFRFCIGVVFQVGRWFLKGLATDGASQADALIAAAAYRFRQAFRRTVGVFGSFDGRRVTLDRSTADGTLNGYHGSIISRVGRQKQPQTTVYNVEVDDAHTYFANGVLVHNCPACLMADGRIYRIDEGFDEHPNGRCAMIPILRNVPPVQYQTGQQWFAEQPEATQRRILGAGRFDAWQAGRASLDDMVTRRDNPDWGGSLHATRVSDL